MMVILLTYRASMLIIGFAMLVAGLNIRKQEKIWLNPFHFETISGSTIRYITAKSESMLKKCDVYPQKLPGVFLCLKKKYDENKDVQSKDPKKAFIGMMNLVNTSAECFNDVTASQALCLFENKQEMEKTVDRNVVDIGQIMDHILQECNATSEIVSCANVKKNRLVQLAKTMLTNPAIAETTWNVGDSLKTCLSNHPTIEKCVLNKHKMRSMEGGSGPPNEREILPAEMSMPNPIKELRQNITTEAVGALLCLRIVPNTETQETFNCIKSVMNDTSDMAKDILKKMAKMETKKNDNPRDESKEEGEEDEEDKEDEEDEEDEDDKTEKLKGHFHQRRKRTTEDDNDSSAVSFFTFLRDDGIHRNDKSSITIFELLFNHQSMERVKTLINLMKTFISTCTSWAPPPPPPEAMRSRPKNEERPHTRKIIDHGGLTRPIIDHGGLPARPARPPSEIIDASEAVPKVDVNFERCKSMYDEINSFIDTGHGNIRPLLKPKEDDHKRHESSTVIIAACTGSVIVGILILLAVIVIFVVRRRYQKKRIGSSQAPPPTAPHATCPSVYTTFPRKHMPVCQMPPSYHESLDPEKYCPSGTVFSQILNTSIGEGTEKSC